MRNYLTRGNDGWGFGLFDRAFEDFFKPVNFMGNNFPSMKTDVKEDQNGYLLSVDLPGFDKEDIKLTLENGYLTVEAKKEEKQEEGEYIRRERSMAYKRSYFVGKQVTENDVKAKYDKGVLSLSVPKKQLEQPPKGNIQID